MSTAEHANSKSTFQGSETTSVEVSVYPHNDDLLIDTGLDRLDFSGKTEREHLFAVESVSTNKALGAPSGSWTVTLKAPESLNLGDYIVDDDWIDITFFRHGRPHHTMRGLIDAVRERTEAGGEGGATSKTWTLSGKDFGAVLEKTPIWFNRFAAENAGNDFTLDIFESINVGGPPDVTVRKIIYGFMETLTGLQRANWQMPQSAPKVGDSFTDTFIFNNEGFNNIPERESISTQFMDPNGVSVWGLAQEWSDPQMCELFCDLGDFENRQMFPALNYSTNTSAMIIFFRDIPFPTVSVHTPFPNKNSPWFQLPTVEISSFELAHKDIGRGGLERYNAYMVSPQVLQSLGGRVDTQAPLWDPHDIRRHGLRKMEVQSRYVAKQNDLFTMSSIQRYMVRDWNAMNPYLYNGDLELARLRPDIRIGTRLRIRGHSEDENETYYVEQVGHRWSLPTGGRTTVGVTRGYRGTDEKMLSDLKKLVSRYVLYRDKSRTLAEEESLIPGNLGVG